MVLASAQADIPKHFPPVEELMLYLLGIGIFLLLNAFFVAIEFALVKVRKSQLMEVAGLKPKRTHLALHALAKLEGYLSAGQLGITVASLALGMLGEPLVAHYVGPLLLKTSLPDWGIRTISFIVATASFSFVHVIIGEQVPKVLAIRKPVGAVLLLIQPLHMFYRTFGWAIAVINGSANWILKNIFRVEPAGHEEVHSAEELARLVEESERHDEVTETEREILINALELNDIKVKDVMTARGDVIALDVDNGFKENLDMAMRTKHTRFPLVRGHLDEALGLVHIKDFLKLIGDESPDLMRIKRELKMVPETMPLDTLLTFFLRERAHLAMVVDEFGNPSGLVFLDNVIEELVGDIQDEFDNERSAYTPISDDEFVVEGSISLYELEDHVPELDLESGEVTTVGGYITQLLGHLPEPGESVRVEGFEAKVTSSDGRRVGQVHFRRIEEGEDALVVGGRRGGLPTGTVGPRGLPWGEGEEGVDEVGGAVDGEGVVAFLDPVGVGGGDAGRDLADHGEGEVAVLGAVPDVDGDADLFEVDLPIAAVDIGVADEVAATLDDAFAEAAHDDLQIVVLVDRFAVHGGDPAEAPTEGGVGGVLAGDEAADGKEGRHDQGGDGPEFQEDAIGEEEGGLVGEFPEGWSAADDGGSLDSFGKPVGGGEGIGAATRDAHDEEALVTEGVGEAAKEGGPVGEAAIGLRGGLADAGAVGGDDAQALFLSDLVEEPALEAGAGPTMEVIERSAGRVAVFREADLPAVGEGMELRFHRGAIRHVRRGWCRRHVPAGGCRRR